MVIAAPAGKLKPTFQLERGEEPAVTVTVAVNPPAHWLPMVIVTPQEEVVTGAAVVVVGAAVVVTGAAVVVVGAVVVVVGAVVVVTACVVVVGAAVVVVGAPAPFVLNEKLLVASPVPFCQISKPASIASRYQELCM